MSKIGGMHNIGGKPFPLVPELPFTIRGSLRPYFRSLGIVPFVVAVLLLLLAIPRFGVATWLIATAITVGVIALGLFLLSRRSVTVTEHDVEFVNAFGVRRSIDFHEIRTALMFTDYREGVGGTTRVIIGYDDSPFVSIHGMFWDEDDVARLLYTLNTRQVRFAYITAPTNYSTLRRDYPHVLTGVEKRPAIAAVALLLVILLIVMALVSVF